MNPLTYIGKFFQWIGWRQSRETAIRTAQLQLAEQQHRAEVFALTTTHQQEIRQLEEEWNNLKSKMIEVEQECALAIGKLKSAQTEVEGLRSELDFIRQQASKDRVDKKAVDMLVEVAKRKEGWTLDSLFRYFFGAAIPQGEFFFAQLVETKHVEKIGVNDKGVDLWGATEKGRQLAFSRTR